MSLHSFLAVIESTITAKDLADLFMDHVIKHHGIGLEYRSDQDKLFKSAFWDRVWSRLGTTISLSTAYRHQTAGQAERSIKELRKYLAIYTLKHPNWTENLSVAEYAFNCAKNSSTGCSPFELNHGFQPTDLGNIGVAESLKELPDALKKSRKSADGWLTKFNSNLESAKESLVKAHKEMKEQYDKKKLKTKDKGKNVYLRN